MKYSCPACFQSRTDLEDAMYLIEKGYSRVIASFFSGFILLTGCANPLMDSSPVNTNMQFSGSLEINLTLSESDRSVVPEDYQDAIFGYEITLSGIQAMGPILFTTPVAVISALPLGKIYCFGPGYRLGRTNLRRGRQRRRKRNNGTGLQGKMTDQSRPHWSFTGKSSS